MHEKETDCGKANVNDGGDTKIQTATTSQT